MDWLFPKQCLVCHCFGYWLCPVCQEKLKPNQLSFCPVCHQPQMTIKVCLGCRHKSFLDGLWVMADYQEPLIRQVIHLIKYNFAFELSSILDSLIKSYFETTTGWRNDFLLLPVPLHRRRFRWRGFNQAELLAAAVSRVKGNPIGEPLLKRVIYRSPQVKLNAVQRFKNIKDNFQFNNFYSRSLPSELVLVDDVYTTGATMQECARILKNNGVGQVWGLVIARG